ncbi:MAG: esterase-like activity of phytase family protein, partial [Planctomycetota bacterium]|nr:esterase-like activity of phytase family protein [Planctomycetota bacterium]
MMRRLQPLLFLLTITSFAAAGPIDSSHRDVLTPNTGAFPQSGVTLGGTTFINRGLQGVGRFAANAIDAATGESLGSISDMQITDFQNLGAGSWSGTFNFLPDRGYNSGSIFSNYAARINTFSFVFTPQTTSAVTTSQDQIQMTFQGSTRFTYDHDNNPLTAPIFTTGMLATGSRSLYGVTVPSTAGNTTQSDGIVNNRLTIDAEGLALDNRSGKGGSGWVSDEYGASIYHFNASKEIDGVLKLPAALIPFNGNTPTFDGDQTNGRRTNQGLEGLAQSPDGTKLFALMQSATIQDSGAGNQGRSNDRLLVYDVKNSDSPSDPVAQYVIQLPRVDDNGGTPAVNRTAAQSSIIALNDHQILILSRDGNGRGASGAPVFKSILLADLNGATNIDGLFDAKGAAVAPGGVLNPSVTPLSWTEALNLLGKLDLSITELEQFGLNLNTAPGNINTISEKWEALSLVSADDPLAPNDYFLFVGND